MAVPAERVRALNDAPVRPERGYVLHWMLAARRVRSSPSLERAAELARELGRPLAVLEPLHLDDPYASDRHHAFAAQGMADTARRLAGRVRYLPFVERARGEGEALLEALAARACAVVTDDFPTVPVAGRLAGAAAALDVRLEAVDGSAVVPFRLAGRDFATAHAYRRFLQRALPAWLDRLPAPDPLARLPRVRAASLPREALRRWPAAAPADLARPARLLAALPIDHAIPAVGARGGAEEGERRLRTFLAGGLDRYAERRNVPDEDAGSGLSPWLHHGHLSTFDVVRAVLRREGWTAPAVAPRIVGARAGWWGLAAPAEAFLDELVTWRELAFVTCAARADHAEYASLPGWARATLGRHAADRRPVAYGRDDLSAARTHDALWNAAQRQLVAEGRIHGYLRMLWGKKVLEWSASPEEALATLLDLNDRFALDGRDPCSVAGIAWCLGRYDRPWGPERPIFGTIRYMSSRNTARKVAVKRYLARFGGSEETWRAG